MIRAHGSGRQHQPTHADPALSAAAARRHRADRVPRLLPDRLVCSSSRTRTRSPAPVHFDVDTLQNALGNMAQVVAAILGIVITVVSIVVQLAATRYTPRIADMFFRDRTNLAVLGFFVVACINAVWVLDLRRPRLRAARSRIVFTMVLVTASLLIMVPYFAYVFDFLDPDRVVGRIQQQAVASALDRGRARRRRARRAPAARARRRRAALRHRHQRRLAEGQGDRRRAPSTPSRISRVAYLAQKKARRRRWFAIGARIRAQPRLRLARRRVDRRHRRQAHLARVQGAAPVPVDLQRGARRDARHQPPHRHQHALHRRGGARRRRRRGARAGGEVLQHLPARDAQRARTCAPPTTCSISIASSPSARSSAGRRRCVSARSRSSSSTTRRSRTAWISASSPRRWPTIWRRCASTPSRCTAPSHDAMLEAAARGRQGGGEPDAGAHAARRAQGAGQAGHASISSPASATASATRGRSSTT